MCIKNCYIGLNDSPNIDTSSYPGESFVSGGSHSCLGKNARESHSRLGVSDREAIFWGGPSYHVS